MTTIHMLDASKESYQNALKRYERHLKGLTDKYYTSSGVEISPEAREEIHQLHQNISECEDVISNIDNAIAVIGDSFDRNDHDDA